MPGKKQFKNDASSTLFQILDKRCFLESGPKRNVFLGRESTAGSPEPSRGPHTQVSQETHRPGCGQHSLAVVDQGWLSRVLPEPAITGAVDQNEERY